MNKSLYDISWKVEEPEYREDPSLSYSTLGTFKRSGYNELDHLFDKKESPSLTFGSAVDAIITGGEEEFNQKFVVADFPSISDSLIKIAKTLFEKHHIVYASLCDIPADTMIETLDELAYYTNWKKETRVKKVVEDASQYYDLLHLCEGKTLLSSAVYNQVLASVRALRESESTKFMFAPNNPFDDSIQRFYQLKFKAVLNDIPYRCMADLIIVDHNKKTVYPKDLKTSSHKEWDFHKSFVDWDYQIQARLYWRIIRKVMDSDEVFKDYKLEDYEFIVVNKETLTPLVWKFPYTQALGNIYVGKNKQIEFIDPEILGKELYGYLNEKPSVPNGIIKEGSNNLSSWLDTL